MVKIKLCGLTRPEDIATANALRPEYIGFVFVPRSRRYVSMEQAAELKRLLSPDIAAVGVFADEKPEIVSALLGAGVIDCAQLHGNEDAEYFRRLRILTGKPLIQAFRVHGGEEGEADIRRAEDSVADYVLLDSGGGSGAAFDWTLARKLRRPCFLAGGLTVKNVSAAVRTLHPYGVDVSSGIETEGHKDAAKMAAFVQAAREAV